MFIMTFILTILITTFPFIHSPIAQAGMPIHVNLRALVGDEMPWEWNDGHGGEWEEEPLHKTPITLDISGNLPREIIALRAPPRSSTFLYHVPADFNGEYRMGDIVDGDQLILEDKESIDRRVQFSVEEDGMKVVRITDVWEGPDGLRREMVEMMKLPEEPFYEELRRFPVNVDLLEECPDWVNVQRDPDFGVITYTIRPELKNRAIIGMAKYAGHNVEDGPNDEVIERSVILRTSGGNPEILVSSHTKNGQVVTTRNVVLADEE